MLKVQRILIYFGFLFLGILIGALILPLILAGEIYEYQDSVDGVHLPPVDAIVCLAGGRGRISAAGDLWYRYWELDHMQSPPANPPVLYLSGVGPQSTWNVLIRQLRSGIRQVIRPENVILEAESQNTETNALWLARIAEKRGWTRILLVTSTYHMRRAAFIFDQIFKAKGRPIQIQTLSAIQDPFEAAEWRSNLHGMHVTVIEYFKWVYYKYFWKVSLGFGENDTVILNLSH